MSGWCSRRCGAAVTAVVSAGMLLAGLVGAPVARAASTNLVVNASAETLAGGVPRGWVEGGSGVNTRVLSVPSGGAYSGQRFTRTAITRYSSGAAWWTTPAVAARGGVTYTFSDRYRSAVPTRIDVAITANGRTGWRQLITVRAARGWSAASIRITAPAGTARLAFAHVLPAAGTLDVDAVQVVATVPPVASGVQVSRPSTPTGGLVSVTFDDGWANQFANAFPLMRMNGVPGTFYLISGALGTSQYMTVAQAKQVQAAGSEIGSHTVSHPNLTTLDSARLNAELANSKAALERDFGPVTDLAYPNGAGNPTVEAAAAKYYSSARSTNGGQNVRGQYNRYELTIGYVLDTTTPADVKKWISQAQANGSWLILCYHGITDSPGTYDATIANFGAEMAAIRTSGIKAVTVRDGLRLTS